jgi:hypothetical protein
MGVGTGDVGAGVGSGVVGAGVGTCDGKFVGGFGMGVGSGVACTIAKDSALAAN